MTTNDARLGSRAYKRIRLYVLDRDRHICQIRGPRCTYFATDVDHIVARADGGDVWNPANLRAACRHCNGWAAAQRTNRRRGYTTTVLDYETTRL